MIAAIVAADLNNGIGYNNELLVRIPKDLKRFIINLDYDGESNCIQGFQSEIRIVRTY